jgi:hypothetical protein
MTTLSVSLSPVVLVACIVFPLRNLLESSLYSVVVDQCVCVDNFSFRHSSNTPAEQHFLIDISGGTCFILIFGPERYNGTSFG